MASKVVAVKCMHNKVRGGVLYNLKAQYDAETNVE